MINLVTRSKKICRLGRSLKICGTIHCYFCYLQYNYDQKNRYLLLLRFVILGLYVIYTFKIILYYWHEILSSISMIFARSSLLITSTLGYTSVITFIIMPIKTMKLYCFDIKMWICYGDVCNMSYAVLICLMQCAMCNVQISIVQYVISNI